MSHSTFLIQDCPYTVEVWRESEPTDRKLRFDDCSQRLALMRHSSVEWFGEHIIAFYEGVPAAMRLEDCASAALIPHNNDWTIWVGPPLVLEGLRLAAGRVDVTRSEEATRESIGRVLRLDPYISALQNAGASTCLGGNEQEWTFLVIQDQHD